MYFVFSLLVIWPSTRYLGSYTAILEPRILPYNNSLDFIWCAYWCWCEVHWEQVISQFKLPLFAMLSPMQHGHRLPSAYQCRCLLLPMPAQPAENSLKTLVIAPANIVHLWKQLERQWFSLENDTNFALRGMPGWSYEPVWQISNESSPSSLHGTVAMGGNVRWLDSATDLQLDLARISWGKQGQPCPTVHFSLQWQRNQPMYDMSLSSPVMSEDLHDDYCGHHQTQ